LGYQYSLVQITNSSNKVVIPQQIILTDVDNLVVTFTEPVSGYATVGGGSGTSGTSGTSVTDIVNDTSPQLGGDLDLNSYYLDLSAPDNTKGSGWIDTITLGETVSAGQTVYIKSDGAYWLSDASATTTMPAVAIMLEAGTAAQSKKALFWGFMRNDAWSWSFGGDAGILYASTIVGELTQTKPSTSGDQVQVMGVAKSATVIIFNPNFGLAEVT
jgi:hypothetical protein